MELSKSINKKFVIFSQRKFFLIFPQMNPPLFKRELEKIKKIYHEKISYISGNGNPEKSFYVSGNRTFLCFRKLFIFLVVTFQDQKLFTLFLIKKQNFLN